MSVFALWLGVSGQSIGSRSFIRQVISKLIDHLVRCRILLWLVRLFNKYFFQVTLIHVQLFTAFLLVCNGLAKRLCAASFISFARSSEGIPVLVKSKIYSAPRICLHNNRKMWNVKVWSWYCSCWWCDKELPLGVISDHCAFYETLS